MPSPKYCSWKRATKLDREAECLRPPATIDWLSSNRPCFARFEHLVGCDPFAKSVSVASNRSTHAPTWTNSGGQYFASTVAQKHRLVLVWRVTWPTSCKDRTLAQISHPIRSPAAEDSKPTSSPRRRPSPRRTSSPASQSWWWGAESFGAIQSLQELGRSTCCFPCRSRASNEWQDKPSRAVPCSHNAAVEVKSQKWRSLPRLEDLFSVGEF